MKYIFFLLMLLAFRVTAIEPDKKQATYDNLAPVSQGEIVRHTYFKLAYSEKHEQALWVFYLLTPANFNNSIERSDDFREDPKVKTGSATPGDYKDSGTDRGHLCPAADMKINETAVSESFLMSNMSPQLPGFNRGTWNRLEALVREWALIEDSLFIVSGPVFKDNLGVVGGNKVTIPGYYYKVIYDPTGDDKMIAFLLRNNEKSQPLENAIVPADSIEAITGIDFFPALPDLLEKKLEKSSSIDQWDFHPKNSPEKNPSSVSNDKAEQCKGIAKSTGKRCKTSTTNPNGFCNDHQNQAPIESKVSNQCIAKTKDGSQCKRKADPGSKYCFQHKK